MTRTLGRMRTTTDDDLPYTIGLEPIGTLWPELLPLAVDHNAEVGAFPELAFEPNTDFLDRADAIGILRVYTVRENDGRKLVGYAAFMIGPFLFHKSAMAAHHLALYVAPAHRRQGVALGLLQAADANLQALGIKLVFQHTKAGPADHGALLQRIGYSLVDHVYVRRL